MRYLKNRKILIAGGVILVLFLFLQGKNGKNVTAVTTYTVTKTEVIKNVTASGTTEAKKELTVKSPVAARIAAMPFESGDTVKKGDVIIKFDYSSLKAAADTSYAAYLTAKAAADSLTGQINSAEKTAEDLKFKRDIAWRAYMGDDGDATKQAFKTAEAAYRAAEATLTVLKDKEQSVEETAGATSESYNVTKSNLNNVYIRAPEDGLLALQSLNTNDSISVGENLFTISNANGLRFNAEVDETDVENVKVGEPTTITLDGYPNDTFTGTVARIDAKTRETSNGSTVVDVDIDFNLQDKRPIVGLNGSADIEVGKETEQIAIPFDAILFGDEDENYVFVVDTTTNTAKKVKVALGFEGNDYYVIKSGVVEGDIIVLGNEISGLSDGSKISLIETK